MLLGFLFSILLWKIGEVKGKGVNSGYKTKGLIT